jgi:putative zinc finger/helix-turn-helix YgiT family protein
MRRCHECGTPLPEAREVWVPYAEALSEAGWDIRVRGHAQTCDHCGEETVTISRLQALNQALADAIARKPQPLAPAEIGFIRAHLRLNGRQLAAIIGVDEATVSRWLGGQRLPSSSNDRHLRLLARLGPAQVGELYTAEEREPWSSTIHATVERGEWLLAAER